MNKTIKNSVVWFLCVTCASLNVLSFQDQPGSAQTKDRGFNTPAQQGISKWPAERKRFALIIGVDQYTHPEITRLNGAANDAKSLADALKQYAGFPKENITILTSNMAQDKQPTRANIITALADLQQQIPSDGLLIVYFAGHGISNDQGRAYLIPSDATTNPDVLQELAIPVDKVTELIRKTHVEQVMVIIDACRNNPSKAAGTSRIR